MTEIFTSKSGKVFAFIQKEGECFCDECVFNTMGAEGDQLCGESPDCSRDNGDGYYILKSTPKPEDIEDEDVGHIELDWDKEMDDWRKEQQAPVDIVGDTVKQQKFMLDETY